MSKKETLVTVTLPQSVWHDLWWIAGFGVGRKIVTDNGPADYRWAEAVDALRKHLPKDDDEQVLRR